MGECLNTLLEFYKIANKEDLVVYKTDYPPVKLPNSTASTGYRTSLFIFDRKGNKLDLTPCSTATPIKKIFLLRLIVRLI